MFEDGQFLIPDDVDLYPVKNSKVETFAELYGHWQNYSSLTAKSINAEAAAAFEFGSISGSYSSEHESVKQHQVEDNAATTRVQIHHDLYKAKLEPDSVLQPAFKSRVLEIASHLQHNNTEFAKYLPQLLVRDFGLKAGQFTRGGGGGRGVWKCKFRDPKLVTFCLCIYLKNHFNKVILK